ncbi:MAG TPA: polyphosphate:AMP phosphotransferase, partial [Haliangium sp.]|nr:polyphosphate:AMP phosphotransferase [Haliangium sp.]
MFESATLPHTISKEEYDAQVPALRLELLEVQKQLERADFPVVIVIGGAEGAGKGDTANLLHAWMDARLLQTYAMGPSTEAEAHRPPYWRFWMALPPRGRTSIFLGSWYTEPMLHAALEDDAEEDRNRDLDSAIIRINAFEKELVDDGALLIKLWLHLGKKEQRQRFRALEKDPDTRWRVTARDWELARAYDHLLPVWERTLRQTSTGEAPWTVLAGGDARYRNLTCARHVAGRIAEHLARRGQRASQPAGATPGGAAGGPASAPVLVHKTVSILDQLDLGATLDKETYDRKLAKWQARLNELGRRAQKQQVAAIAVFEGWDAAGKGGAIRRITRALDARYYRIIPIAAPTDEEKAHHYLWRFWRHLPRLGSLTIYDRSWYGRVLVERVEGFASTAEWMRAYHEINDFEEQLAAHG